MKLLLTPFPQIPSYCNQGVKFNEILAFLKKMHYSQWSWLAKQKGHSIHQCHLWGKSLPHLFPCSLLCRSPEMGQSHKAERVQHGEGDMFLTWTQ